MALAVAGSCSSDLTPSLGSSYAMGVTLKSKTKKKLNSEIHRETPKNLYEILRSSPSDYKKRVLNVIEAMASRIQHF